MINIKYRLKVNSYLDLHSCRSVACISRSPDICFSLLSRNSRHTFVMFISIAYLAAVFTELYICV